MAENIITIRAPSAFSSSNPKVMDGGRGVRHDAIVFSTSSLAATIKSHRAINYIFMVWLAPVSLVMLHQPTWLQPATMTPRTRRLSVSVKGEQRIASIKLALFIQHLPLHCKNVAEVNYGAMIAKRFCNSFVDRRRLLFICISSWPTSLTWQATASDVGMCCSQSIAH